MRLCIKIMTLITTHQVWVYSQKAMVVTEMRAGKMIIADIFVHRIFASEQAVYTTKLKKHYYTIQIQLWLRLESSVKANKSLVEETLSHWDYELTWKFNTYYSGLRMRQ